jgi:poly(A) polymerase
MSEALLADAEWRNADGLKRVVAALTDKRGGPRIVGGAVRDTLLGLPVTDIDLATMLSPDMVIDRLEAAGIKAIPTGIDHGTVTAVADGKNYEITTLRRDVATDGRRATVAFSTDWKEDASRRDFTINALYANPETGEIFDYFGGLADLDEGNLRFIGDASERIAEDHLRILRYFRFLARFGEGAVDQEAIRACAAAANSLLALSRERIAGELLKLLALPDPRQSVALMVRHKIFSTFLPELDDDAVANLERLLTREQTYSLKRSLPARLLALLPRNAGVAQNVAMRLKLSNAMRADMVARVSGPPPIEANIRALAYLQNIACAGDAAMLFANNTEIAACIKRLENWNIPELAIKGGDLIRRGLPAGPVVAETLKLVEAQWISEDFPSDRIEAIADQAVSEALSASKKA